MKYRFSTILLSIGILGVSLAISSQACATLGEPANSVAKDRKALSAKQSSSTPGAKFSVQEITSDNNVIREYIAPSGVVFGIAWSGIAHPDLAPLLGSYTSAYQKVARQTARKPGRRNVRMQADGIVVEKWGHMGNLKGKAYLPALIPQGVNANEIK